MSLLLDALKRAEQAKLAKQQEATGVAPEAGREFSLADEDIAPAAPVAADAAAIPARPGADLALEAAEPSIRAVQLSNDEQREAARNLFAAKRAEAGERPKWILPAATASGIAICFGAWYVWHELGRLGAPAAPNATASRAQPITQAPRAPLSAPDPAIGQLAPAASMPTPPIAVSPSPAVANSVSSARAANPRPAPPRTLAENIRAAATPSEPGVAVRVSRDNPTPRVSPELESAYAALRNGDYGAARKLYFDVLQGDPLNLDAHLGLAAALARSGDAVGAVREYRHALEIDPRSSVALAGLAAIGDQSNPGALEVELRTLLAKGSGSAALSFSLGNLYAGQARWSEAQQAYFDAFRLEPENSDYLYNLAVSLDQLRQKALALDYYQRALAASARTGGQLNRAQVTRRVDELKTAN